MPDNRSYQYEELIDWDEEKRKKFKGMCLKYFGVKLFSFFFKPFHEDSYYSRVTYYSAFVRVLNGKLQVRISI